MAREVDAMSGLSEKLEDARRSVRDNVRGALEDTFREWCAAADIRIVVDVGRERGASSLGCHGA